MESEIIKKEKFNWFKMFWDGFTSMSKLSRTLWIIAIVKLIIMFVFLKPFFFPNVLNSQYDSADDKANHVGTELIEKSKSQE